MYNNAVEYEWGEVKQKANIDRHGIDFEAIHSFEWEGATILADERKDYQELRFIAYGYIRERLISVVYTERGENIRIISMRKANSREVQRYG